MQLHLAARHWIGNETHVEELKEFEEDIARTGELIRSTDVPVHLSLYLSSDGTHLPKTTLPAIGAFLSKCAIAGYSIRYNNEGQTAGEKFVNHLFPQKGRNLGDNPVLALHCLDQFPITTEESLERILDISERLLKEEHTYANGSRDLPVVLANFAEADSIRKIQELLFSAVTEFIFAHPEVVGNPDPAYATLGEPTSGFYFLNPNTPFYRELAHEIHGRQDLYTKPGFTIEYFTALAAGINLSVSTGYVTARQNPIAPQTAENELESANRRVRTVAHDLRTTSVRNALQARLMKHATIEPLFDFFDERLVRVVTYKTRLALAGH